MRWEAILLAAGRLGKDFSEFGDLPSKAYLPIFGKRMAEYVLEVLQAIPSLRRIVSVVPEGAPNFLGTVSVKGGNSIIDSMASGFQALLPDTQMALVAACDLPCLSQAGVEDFMRECESSQAGLCYSFISRRDSEKKFPGIPHTYIRSVEGEFCGGGLTAFSPNRFPALRSLADRALQSRKNIFKIAAILGLPFLIKLLARRATVNDAERQAAKVLGFPAKGILSRFPEIAFNVDDSKALGLAKAFLERKIRA